MASITEIQSTDLITNSRGDINNNFDNLNNDKIETSTLDTDTTLAANSDSKIATQKAVKAYVDSGGNANASETNKGIVEIATQAEVDAGTDTGGTGATLAVVPSQIAGLGRSYKIDTNYSATDLSGTTNPYNIISATVTGGKLSTNNAIRIKAFISNFSIHSGTVDIDLVYGSTTLASLTLDDGTGDVDDLKGMIDATLLASGATGTQIGSLNVDFSADKLLSSDALPTTGFRAFSTGTATEDSTGDLTLALIITWTNADADNDCVPGGVIMELIT